MVEYNVNLIWDSDAAVWIAESPEILGLVLESGSLDALIERVRAAVPELLELNGCERNANLFFHSERKETVYA